MMYQIYLSARDIIKKWKECILFMIVLSVSFWCLIPICTSLHATTSNIAEYDRLSSYDITYFSAYYRTGKSIASAISNEQIQELLYDYIDARKKAFFVINANDDRYEDISVYFGVGNVGETFGFYEVSDYENDVVALIGADVKGYEIGDVVKVAGKNLAIAARLDESASCLDYQTYTPLNESIIVLTSYSNFNKLSDARFYYAIIPDVLKLNNATEDEIDHFVSTINARGTIALIPRRMKELRETMIGEYLTSEILLQIVIICVLAFVGIGIMSVLHSLIDMNLKEYAVQRLYGATFSNIELRILLFALALLLPPMIAVFAFTRDTSLPIWYIAILQAAMIAIVTIAPLIRLRRQDMVYFLRRDV